MSVKTILIIAAVGIGALVVFGGSDPRKEYQAAVREFASARGFMAAAQLRATDHPQDAILRDALEAAQRRTEAARARLAAAVTRMGAKL